MRDKIVAVDLTPILPGGENGGAKIFVIELLIQLSELLPKTQFILLTQSSSHEELVLLDRENMRRQLVLQTKVKTFIHPRLMRFFSSILGYFPARYKQLSYTLVYKLIKIFKRNSSGAVLRDNNVDLLFCPFTAPTFFELGIPTVCTIYDLQYKVYPEFFDAEDVAHRDRIFIDACHKSSVLVAISDFSRDTAIAYGNLNVSKVSTVYLRMAQRISNSKSQQTSTLTNLGLTTKKYLIYPANFWKHKNHELLLTAFGMACDNGLPADIKLVFTGAPSERQKWLSSAVIGLSLEDRIVFPGYVSNIELEALMASSKGMVFPSLYEGFGLPVIEAMAAEVPVACSNTTSLPEVVADAAILFDPRVPTQIADAIISLVEDEALCKRLIALGKVRAAEFSDSRRMASEYLDVFSQACKNVRYENFISGHYEDGWMGKTLDVEVAFNDKAEKVEIEFSAPDWLPSRKIKLQGIHNGKKYGIPLVFERGTNGVLTLPIESNQGRYSVVASSWIVPKNLGYGDDMRDLSVLLLNCKIVCRDGSCIELFSSKNLKVLHES